MQSSVTPTVRVFDAQRRSIEAAQVELKVAAAMQHRGHAQLRVSKQGLQLGRKAR